MIKKTWSIIIPTLNEEKSIGHCLDSLCAMQHDLADVEVIVADNGSVDRTVTIVMAYTARLGITVLSLPNVSVGALRNAAAARATGRLFAFLDADCVVGPAWLQAAAGVLSRHPSAIVGAHYALPSDAGWPSRLCHQRFFEGRRGEVPYIPGGNLVMESSVFWRIGGFDTALRSNEDSQFCSRAWAAGSRVLAFPELAVTHLGAEKNLLHFARRQIWHGSNVVSRSALRGNLRAIGLAAYTLGCISCLFAAGFSGRPTLLLLALVAAMFPPIVIALRGAGRMRGNRDVPPLILLLVTYAFVRACVLPLALLRGVRQW